MKNYKELLEGKSKTVEERVKCTKCPWRGTMDEVHTDRGGHNFLCPTCGNAITSDKKYPGK